MSTDSGALPHQRRLRSLPRCGASARRRGLGLLTAASLITGAITLALAQDQPSASATPAVGAAANPPMGWNTWYAFGCNLDEDKVKSVVDAIAESDLKTAGYKYIGVDDCWSAGRNSDGSLKADPAKFPSGMKSLGDYIHSKGLKFGIYGAPMQKTCAGYVGSYGHEKQDAETFASWGVDLLKYDWCHGGDQLRTMQGRFAIMRDALKSTGRPIVYDINPGSMHNAEFQTTNDFGDYGHMTRAAEDLNDQWSTPGSEPSHYFMGTLNLVDVAGQQTFRNAPDRWVDWDYLQLGINKERPANEDRAQFAMWAIGGGPLFIGADPRTMTADTKDILTNSDIIKVNQSWAGSAGRRISIDGNADVWSKPLAGGDVAVAMLNRGTTPLKISTTSALAGLGGSSSYRVKNLWTKATSTSSGSLTATVPGRDAAIFRVSRDGARSAPLKEGTHQLSTLHPLATDNGWGPVEINSSVGGSAAGDGNPLTIRGKTYATGLGTHAGSGVNYWLGGACQRFTAKVGVDDEVPAYQGSVQFGVYGDGRLLAYTDTKTSRQGATALSVPVTGVKALELRAITTVDGKDYDHADWAEPQVTCTGSASGTASFVSDRTWVAQSNGYGPAERDQSNGNTKGADGNLITFNGVHYHKGIGVHADSSITLSQTGCTRFTAVGGIDAETAGKGTVQFKVLGDGKPIYTSDAVTDSSPALIDVDTTGYRQIDLQVTNASNDDEAANADWASAALLCP